MRNSYKPGLIAAIYFLAVLFFNCSDPDLPGKKKDLRSDRIMEFAEDQNAIIPDLNSFEITKDLFSGNVVIDTTIRSINYSGGAYYICAKATTETQGQIFIKLECEKELYNSLKKYKTWFACLSARITRMDNTYSSVQIEYLDDFNQGGISTEKELYLEGKLLAAIEMPPVGNLYIRNNNNL